jgi:hypothetical protein
MCTVTFELPEGGKESHKFRRPVPQSPVALSYPLICVCVVA